MKAVGIAASQRIQCIVSVCSLEYKVSLGTGRICERVWRYMVHRMRTTRVSLSQCGSGPILLPASFGSDVVVEN
jgi:hypothetical protein